MSSAGVSPPTFDVVDESPYATAPTSWPPTYTGEPDMPAQIPPARSIAGLSTSTTIMSRPGAIPSFRTPRMSTENGSTTRPCSTV